MGREWKKIIIKTVDNLDEIRSEVKKAKLPKEFVLSGSETIVDMDSFIETHLAVLGTKKLIRLHRPYHDRLKKVLDTVNIKIKIKEEERYE